MFLVRTGCCLLKQDEGREVWGPIVAFRLRRGMQVEEWISRSGWTPFWGRHCRAERDQFSAVGFFHHRRIWIWTGDESRWCSRYEEATSSRCLEGILFLIFVHFGLHIVIQDLLRSKLDFRFRDRVIIYDIANFSKLQLLCALQLFTNIGPFHVCGTNVFWDNVVADFHPSGVWICFLET